MTDLDALRGKAGQLWRDTLLLHEREPGIRIASCLSCVELMTALFCGGYLRCRAGDPRWEDRDRFIASKGHGAVSLYPLLADLGFLDRDELRKIGGSATPLGMIPDPAVPGVETVNGSLGHGLGVGLGMALALHRRASSARVVVLHGDGELDEGAVWEAVRLAADLGLPNLFLLVDVNGKSMLGSCRRGMASWRRVFDGFGWRVVCCEDGHDLAQLDRALDELFRVPAPGPSVLLAATVKGHGVPELESAELSHVMTLKPSRIRELLAEKGADCR